MVLMRLRTQLPQLTLSLAACCCRYELGLHKFVREGQTTSPAPSRALPHHEPPPSLPLPPTARNRSFSFDHDKQEWVSDSNSDAPPSRPASPSPSEALASPLRAGDWRSEITTARAAPPGSLARASPQTLPLSCLLSLSAGFSRVFSRALVPLWLVLAVDRGGMGWTLGDATWFIVCVCAVLFALLSQGGARQLARMPRETPLRAYRVGCGTTAVTIAVMVLTPKMLSAHERSMSTFLFLHLIACGACLVAATSLAQAASGVLLRVAASSSPAVRTRPETLANAVGSCGEVAGGAAAGFLFLARAESGSGGGALLSLVPVSLAAYFVSLRLHVNIVGNFGSPEAAVKGRGGEEEEWLMGDETELPERLPSRCGLVGELGNVPLGDILSLIEEGNWQ